MVEGWGGNCEFLYRSVDGGAVCSAVEESSSIGQLVSAAWCFAVDAVKGGSWVVRMSLQEEGGLRPRSSAQYQVCVEIAIHDSNG